MITARIEPCIMVFIMQVPILSNLSIWGCAKEFSKGPERERDGTMTSLRFVLKLKDKSEKIWVMRALA